jgi:toxin-antitoxin system PIN domain toxin
VKPRYLLDVNVPVAVLRRDSPHHDAATTWLRAALKDGAEILVLAETLAATVRLLSNARAWYQPTPPADAVAVLDGLVEATQARVVGAGLEVWRAFVRLNAAVDLTPRMVPDALIASAATAHGSTIVSFDRGLGDYPGVRSVILSSA